MRTREQPLKHILLNPKENTKRRIAGQKIWNIKSKMVDVNTSIITITLKINGLNNPMKRQGLLDRIF